MKEQHEQEMEIDLRELITLMWQKKWYIIAMFVLAVVASYFYSDQLPRVYSTSAMVMIREQSSVQDLFGDQFSGLSGGSNQVATYSRLFTTRPVLEKVIQKLDLRNEETGEFISDRSLRNNISVQGDRDTKLITVSVDYGDPEMAKEIANTLVDVFIKENEEMNRAHLLSASDFVENQLETTEAQLLMLEEQLLEYKTDQGIVYPTEQGKATLNQLISLETIRAETYVDLEFSRVKIQELERYLEEQDQEVVASKTISNNPEMRDLRSRLLSLELELLSLQEIYTNDLTSVTQVKNQIQDIEKRMEETASEITSSRTEAANPLYRSIQEELIQLYVRTIAGETQLKLYDQQIGDVSQQLSNLPQEEMALLRLERENRVAENLYVLLMERQSEIRIQEAMQVADIVVISPAVAEMNPISPRVRLNMAIAGVLGLMVGVGLIFLIEFLDTSIKSKKDLEKLTGLPVIGVIPDLAKVDHRRGYGRDEQNA